MEHLASSVDAIKGVAFDIQRLTNRQEEILMMASVMRTPRVVVQENAKDRKGVSEDS